MFILQKLNSRLNADENAVLLQRNALYKFLE